MSENTKKLLSLLMVACMLFSMVPVSVSAEQEIVVEQTEPSVTEPALLPITEDAPEATTEVVPETTTETVPETTGQSEPVEVTDSGNESTLVSLEFTPVFQVENTDGLMTDDGWIEDPETGEMIKREWWFYMPTSVIRRSTYTATFADGTVLSDTNASGFTYNDQWYSFDPRYNQAATHWTVGNTYYMEVTVMGVTAQVPVTIISSPLQSLTFTPVSIEKKTNGYLKYEWDEETQTDLSYYYYNHGSIRHLTTYTATFVDGTVITGNAIDDSRLTYDGQEYLIEYDTQQSAKEPWVAGNTYYITATVMNVTSQIPVTITDSTVPLELDIRKNVTTQHKDGYSYAYAWLSFTPAESATYIFTSYANFDTYGELFEECPEELINVANDDDSGEGNNFLIKYYLMAGQTYQLWARSYGGDICNFDVGVTRAPHIESISFTPVSVVENTSGYTAVGSYGDPELGTEIEKEYFYYEPWNLLNKSTFTATLSDGQVISGSYGDLTNQYGVSLATDQSVVNPWVADNTYYIGVNVDGIDVQVPVTILPNPLQSITFTPVSVIENTLGYWTNGECWNEENEEYVWVDYYYYRPTDILQKSTYTATFNDGTVLTGTYENGNYYDGYGFSYKGQWYSFSASCNQDAGNPWVIGDGYYVTVEVVGKTAQIPVTVISSPLQRITFDPVFVTENTCGNWTDSSYWDEEKQEEVWVRYYRYEPWRLLQKSSYTAYFTDDFMMTGSCYDGAHGDTGFVYDGQWYSFGYNYSQGAENPWTVGNTYYIDIEILGQKAQLPVTITEPPSMELGVQLEVALGDSGVDVPVFFTPTKDDIYTFTSISPYDTYGTLYEVTPEGETQLAYDDDGGEVYNFKLSQTLKAGVTYKLCVRSWSGSGLNIQVVVNESPVAGVTFDPITLKEYERGYWTWDWDDNGNMQKYYCYDWVDTVSYTVTFKDGTVKQGRYYEGVEYNGEEYRPTSYQAEQNATNPWLAGNTYPGTVTFMGKAYEIYITVRQSVEDNGFEYILQDGKAIITDCTTTGEIIAIPETIDGYPVVGISSLGDALLSALEIRVPDSVTMLSANAFGGNIVAGGIPLQKLVLGKGIITLSQSLFRETWDLQWIEISKKNPNLCSIEGVVYDKAVTTLIMYPPQKQELHMIPDTVTKMEVDLSHAMFANVNIQFGAGITEYKVVDGIIYNADMTKVIRATGAATGTYVMPDTVTQIERCAFQNSSLTAVTISPNVTWLVYGAFQGSSLQEITLPESVDAIHPLAFVDCNDLEKVHIPDIANWCEISGAGNLLRYAHNLYIDGELVKDLVIPENVVSRVYEETFLGGSFETVAIPSSVYSIGYDAFADCENLNKVYITDLAEWCRIYFDSETSNPLYYAKNLYLNGELVTDLTIPDGIWHVKRFAFINSSITSATVPSLVYSIGYEAFYNSSVEDILLEAGSLHTIDESAFENSALKSVELPDCLESLGALAFSGCKALKNVDLGSGINCVGSSTFSATGLESVTIPRQVTDIYWGAFANSALKNVQFDCEAVNIWENAFAGCPLGDLEFGENVKIISDYAFENIEATQIKLPASITEISYRTFAFNKNLVSVTIPDTVEYIYSTAFQGDTNLSHVLYTGTFDQWEDLCVESTELSQATLHCNATGNEVTTEQTCANIRFYCSICDKWETVKKQNTSHTFEDGVCAECGQVGYWEYVVDEATGTVTVTAYVGNDTDVVIPAELEGLPVTAFTEGTFSYSNKLTSVTIPGTVKEIVYGAFQHCKALTSVTMENGVTAIGEYAFAECGNLLDVTLADTVTTIGKYAFYKCSFDSIELPESLTTIEEAAFAQCRSLGEVKIPDSVTYLGDSAFMRCSGIKELTLPASVTQICYSAFSGCNSLKKLVLPEGVTDIAYNAFSGCYNLEELQLPSTLVSIGEDAFANNQVRTLTVPASVQYIGAGAFRNGWSYTTETVIFQGGVPYMESAFESKFVGFYDPAQPGWEEYVAGYEGVSSWYPTTGPEIRVQPQSVTVESGTKAIVSAEGYGHRLSYQWYYAPMGSDTFEAVGGNSFELSMVMDAKNPEGRAYCVITDILGKTATTETVTLKVITFTYTLKNGKATITSYVGDGGDVTIPEELDDYPVIAIGEGAFANCGNLTSVTIHKNITAIGDSAFDGCANLTDVYYESTQAKWKAISIGSNNAPLTAAALHCNHIHDYTLLPSVTVEATCTEEGYVEYTCVYGETYRVILPKIAHERVVETIVAPTCEEEGYTVKKCIHCGETSKVDIQEALGHNYTGDEIIITEPTCTTEGAAGHACSRCDAVQADREIEALGHSMVRVDAKAATCTEAGNTIGTQCSRCLMYGVTPKPIEPLGHDYKTEYVDADPDYTKTTCSRCGDETITYECAAKNGDEEYATLQEAMDAYESGTIQLYANADSIAVTKNVVVDLNSFSLTSLDATVATVTLLDSKTDDYSVADGDYGKIANILGTVVPAEGYVAITEKDGTSYHKVSLETTDMTLRAAKAGIYFNSVFNGDEVVQEYVTTCGVVLSLKPTPEIGASGSAYSVFHKFAVGANTPGTLLQNVMTENGTAAQNERRANLEVYGRAYVQIGDRYYYGETVCRSFREQIELVDEAWNTLSEQQQFEVLAMYRTFRDAMANWTIPNIKNSI